MIYVLVGILIFVGFGVLALHPAVKISSELCIALGLFVFLGFFCKAVTDSVTETTEEIIKKDRCFLEKAEYLIPSDKKTGLICSYRCETEPKERKYMSYYCY